MLWLLVIVGLLAAWLGVESWLASYFFKMLYQDPPAGIGWDQ